PFNQTHGRKLLDDARRELKCGQTSNARRIASDAFNGPYGVQGEAAQVLRSIDAEEHNQARLTADRNAEAGLAAFDRGDYRQARALCGALDLSLLPAHRQARVKEVLRLPEMQPGYQAAAHPGAKTAQPAPSDDPRLPGHNLPGHSNVSDLRPV